MILALLAAIVRAAAAGRTVAGGTARVTGAPAAATAISNSGDAPQPCADHTDVPVSGGGCRLRLDVQVLVAGREVQVGVVAHVSVTAEEEEEEMRTNIHRQGRKAINRSID